MKILITPRASAEAAANRIKPTAIISVVDIVAPELEFAHHTCPILRMRFDDICFEPKSKEDIERYSPPTREIVNSILSFGKNNINDESILLSHCYAGISRSSAAAIIAITPLLGFRYAVKMVAELSVNGKTGADWFFPNNLMIEYADEILGLDKRLVKFTEDTFNY
jgi:predicted protein tyrosine phosphatase